VTGRAAAARARPVAAARRAALPARLEVELATLVDAPPDGDQWLHETKFDGYRIVARVARGSARLLSRNGHDWTDRFPSVAAAAARLPARAAAIDGEVVSVDRRGVSSFQALQRSLSDPARARIAYCAFDLLHLDGWDLRPASLVDRKRALERLLGAGRGDGAIRATPHVRGHGAEALAAACRLGLEGVVSKRAASPYVEGRGRDWRKARCGARQEFVVVGWTPHSVEPDAVGSLLLATYDHGRLRFAGAVGTGFSADLRRALARRLGRLARARSPCVDAPRVPDARWATPSLVGEVKFTEWTRDGRLRHPSFAGLREDKPASAVRRERPTR
jgi:bifunctional non-homologous end joining protein LigD